MTATEKPVRLLLGVLAWGYRGVGGNQHSRSGAYRFLTPYEPLWLYRRGKKSAVVRTADGCVWTVPTGFLSEGKS